MSEIKAGAILNYTSLFIRLGVGFFLSPFVLECLGKAEFGIYTIAGTIISWLALCDFGLGASATKFISEYQTKGDAEGEARYIGNAAILFSIVGAFVLVAGLCIYPFLGNIFPKFSAEELQLYQILYLMTLFNTALMFPMRSLGGISAARQKYKIPGIVGIITSLLSTIGTIILLQLGYKSIALSAMGIGFGILGMLWNIYYCFGILKARVTFGKLDIPLCKTMFSFSIWMFLDQLINIMNTGSSNFIVGMTCGAEEIAVYSYGLALFQYFFMLSGCIAGLFLPRVVGAVVKGASNAVQTDMMIRVARIQFILIGCAYFGIIFFGNDFFSLWVGDTLGSRTSDCWFVTVSIMIPYGFLLMQALGWQILQARNAMKYRVSVLACTSFLSLILGYYLSLNFGTKALAIGTSCSIILGQGLFMNWFYWKRLGLEIPRFFKESLRGWFIWLPLILICGYGINSFISESSWSIFFVKISCFTLFYALIVFFFYANKQEKKSILPFIH
ncbi:MAG: oligosaccharide flippase family protein [Bacteroidaceae bacterium]|nr:oligosaccharide flippase family protein [Bacteroidaceae bacterium]